MRLRTLLLPVIAALVSVAAPAQESPEHAIARAGDTYISEEEFLQRFELLPAFGRHRKSQLETARLELLYSIIAEKLLAQEGAAGGLDRQPAFAAGYRDLEKLLARDELYREEIVRKVTVTPQEVQRGIDRAVRQMGIRFLCTPDEAGARFLRRQIRRPGDLARLQVDTSMHAIRDTATLIWGDADPRMEDAVYALKPGQVSPVIPAGGAWYIVTLTAVQPNEWFMGMTPDVLRERVTAILRGRKERARLDEFVQAALRDKTGYAVPWAMRRLASALRRAYLDGDRDSTIYLTASRVAAARASLGPALLDTLAVAGARVWSTGEALDHLAQGGLGIRRDALSRLPQRLNTEIQVLVQQELLAQEALSRRLDTVPDVRRQLRMWADAFLAGAVKDSLRKTVAVSDSEVWAYLAGARDSAVAPPQVQIRELRTASLEEMRGAMADLDHGAPFADVIRRWSRDTQAGARGGLSDFFPVSSRPPIGSIAGAMDIGQRYGPVTVPDGFSYFELVARRAGPAAGDTSAARRLSRARETLLAMKQRRATTLHLAELGEKLGFAVYIDRLRMLQVTSTPIMTFRVLGFGGRIPAVPFVDPQLDWLDVERPRPTLSP